MLKIEQLVQLQLQTLNDLKDIISQEKSALQQRDADALLTLASSKSTLLNTLQTNDSALASHPEAIQLKSNEALSKQVVIAKTQLQECQQLNAENAALIELNLASLNRLSQALQVSRNSSSLTYDGKGKTSTISSLGDKLEV